MKKILFVGIMVASSFCYNKKTEEFNFKPDWKTGDRKSITITQKGTQYLNDLLAFDTTIISKSELIIRKENKESYILELREENVLIRAASNFYKELAADLNEYQYSTLQFSVNKKTCEVNLLNWNELYKSMRLSNELIVRKINERVPSRISQVQEALKEIMSTYESKANYLNKNMDEIHLLLFPYNKRFVKGDTLRTTDSLSNPFSLDKFNGSTKLTYLSRVDNSKHTCDILIKEIFDFNGYKEMLAILTQSSKDSLNKTIVKSTPGTDYASKAGVLNQLNDTMLSLIKGISFDATNTTSITMDYVSNWPLKATKKVALHTKDKNKKTSVIVNTFITYE